MKILIPYKEKLPVLRYGGTERVVYWLLKELAVLGHEVFLLGHKESVVPGVKVIPWKDQSVEDVAQTATFGGVDIVHFQHNIPANFPFPAVCTIHGNGQKGEVFHHNALFISKKHAENHRAISFVYNGIDFSEYPVLHDKKFFNDSFLFLAKGSWKVKNLKDCTDLAKKMKFHLQIAGSKKLSLSRYLHYQGQVDRIQKIKLAAVTDALLFPVRWHEPFGLAVIEAFALGLPVIGSSYGSLPELISKDRGVLVKSKVELEEALEKFRSQQGDGSFLAEAIRASAEEKFSSKVMAQEYLKYYEKVLRGEELNSATSPPQWNLSQSPQELLAF